MINAHGIVEEIVCIKPNIMHNKCTPIKNENRAGVVARGCNSSTWEAKAGESTQV